MLARTLFLLAALVATALQCEAAEYCSGDQEDKSEKLWEAAAASAECAQHATKDGDSISIAWPCTDSACTQAMRQLGAELPQCTKQWVSINEKAVVVEAVLKCDNPGASGVRGEATNNECAPSEMVELGDWFLQLVTSDACNASKAIVDNYLWVDAPCNSPCKNEISSFSSRLGSCRFQAQLKEESARGLESCKRNQDTDTSIKLFFFFGPYIKDSVYYPKEPSGSSSPANSLLLDRCWWIYLTVAGVVAVSLS